MSIKDPFDFLYKPLREEASQCEGDLPSYKMKNTNDHYYYAGIDVLNMIKDATTRVSAMTGPNKLEEYLPIECDGTPTVTMTERMKLPLPSRPRSHRNNPPKPSVLALAQMECIYATPEVDPGSDHRSDLSEYPEEETYIAVVVKDIMVQKYSEELEASLSQLQSMDSGVAGMESQSPLMSQYLRDLQGPQDDVSKQSDQKSPSNSASGNGLEIQHQANVTPENNATLRNTQGEMVEMDGWSGKSIQSEDNCVHRQSYIDKKNEHDKRRNSFDDESLYPWTGFIFRGILSNMSSSLCVIVNSIPKLIPIYDGDQSPDTCKVEETSQVEWPEKTTEQDIIINQECKDSNSSCDEIDGPILPKYEIHEEPRGEQLVSEALQPPSQNCLTRVDTEEEANGGFDIFNDNIPRSSTEKDHRKQSTSTSTLSRKSNSMKMTNSGTNMNCGTLKDEKANHILGSESGQGRTHPDKEDMIALKKGDIIIVKTQAKIISGYVQVYDKSGALLLVPQDCIKRYDDPNGEPWFYPISINIRAAAALLKKQPMGTYIFYKSTDSSPYRMSLVSDQKCTVKHFQINSYGEGCYGFNVEKTFLTIQDLQAYYQNNRGRLPCRLRRLPSNSPSNLEIDHKIAEKQIIKTESLCFEPCGSVGKGISGQVKKAKFKEMTVAVKTLQVTDKTLTVQEDFLTEAQTLLDLKHENIVHCHGVNISETMDLHIVMELCEKRDVRQCLKKGDLRAEKDGERFLDMFRQILSALEYLKSKQIIHRDIATRNVFLSSDYKVKLGDFGMARCVNDDVYQAEEHESVPVRWAPLEVLSELRFSSKSDIYAAGVTFWEMYSDGKKPYEGLSGINLTKAISKGQLLEKPYHCPAPMYNLMLDCWASKPEKRLSAAQLRKKINSTNYYTNEDYDVRKHKLTEPPSPAASGNEKAFDFSAASSSDTESATCPRNEDTEAASALSHITEDTEKDFEDATYTDSSLSNCASPKVVEPPKKKSVFKKIKNKLKLNR